MAGQPESGHRAVREAGFGPALALRLGLAALTILLGWLAGLSFVVAPWAVAVAVADLLLLVLLRWRPDLPTIWKVIGVAGITTLASVGVQAIPGLHGVFLVFIPAILGGLVLGLSGVATVVSAGLLGSFLMVELSSHHALHGVDVFALLAGTAGVALLATLWHRPAPPTHTARALEARDLLVRLNSLAESLDTGFDLPSLGDMTLEEIAAQIDLERGALIVRSGENPVPISLHGQSRMPWLAPSRRDSLLHRTWTSGVPVRGIQTDGPKHRYILTVPLHDSQGELLGVVAVDRPETPYSEAEEITLGEIVAGTGPLLEVAILFSTLRTRAALEERSRLARDMHDGVAQELAALSYSVDTLLSQAAGGEDVTTGLQWLRQSMRQSLGDIRHQISSLRMVERPDVSLGAVLSANLQTVGSASGMRTTMAIEETSFRFPAHIELAINRLALDVLADARNGSATFFDMEVALSPPNARLAMRHDGRSSLDSTSLENHPSAQHGEILVDPLLPRGRYVEIILGTDPAPSADSLELEDVMAHLHLAEASSGDDRTCLRASDQESHA